MRFFLFFALFLLNFNPLMAASSLTPDDASLEALRQGFRKLVAVVDMQQLLRESTAAQSIQGQLEKQHEKYQQQINAQENSLRDAEKELSRQRTILDPEAYSEKRKEFERRIGDAQRDVQDKKRRLEAAYAKAMDTIQQKVVEILQKISEERKYMLVLPSGQIVLVESSLDITAEVLKTLNSQLPTVKIDVTAKDSKKKD
ncbi:MAG: OmpH family outer membrane protein [Holosporales bacterium]